jgi:hypothetical protein
MKTSIVNKNDRTKKYPELFGAQIHKGAPLFSYAENLFYCGMDQMIKKYNGGYFDFVEITESNVDIESSGFIPLIDKQELVTIETPFGTSAELSFKGASLVVWLFVIEQIAHNAEEKVMSRIFNTIQDIKYCYSKLTDKDGNKLFSENDCTAIHQLID